MRLNRGFVIGIIAFLVLVFIVEMRMPTHFVWNPTFSHNDRQPFGCYVADSLLSASLPGGYSVTGKTLYQLLQEKDTTRRTFMILGENFNPSKVEQKSMLTLLKRGDNVLLFVNTVDDTFADSIFGFIIDSYYYRPNFKRAFNDGRKDTIRWVGDSRRYPKRDFVVAYPLVGWNVAVKKPVLKIDTLAVALGYNQVVDAAEEDVDSVVTADEESTEYIEKKTVEECFPPCAISLKYGKGKFICCPNPLFFTNYGMLDDECRDFVFRILSQVDDRPVVRTESLLQITDNPLKGTSPLTFFLNHPPLRWAIYTALFGILIYFFFTARRRQRVIPVVRPPQNRELEFVKLIGTLYHQRHDNSGLVKKKFMYFSETLRREIMVDIGNAAEDEYNAAMIASHTGFDEKTVLSHLRELRTAVAFEGNMPDNQMRHCIDIMNKIVLRL